jgi:enoyl-CoA hydratase/carnithine racemase
MTEEVTFEKLPCQGNQARFIGVVTLNRPKQLNALNLPMCEAMLAQFTQWQGDDQIMAVIVKGAGEKGLCAGGDVAQVVREIRAADANRFEPRFDYADRFFTVEYQLDELMHFFGKPLVTWAHGITMGGGIGLSVAGSHRVVTNNAKMAMPEIHIGLFPDVGGGWFLNRMPGYSGMLMALTGHVINEADAIFTGLADFYIPHDQQAAFIDVLRSTDWGKHRQDHQNQMTLACREFCAPFKSQLPSSLLAEQFHAIFEAMNRAKVQGVKKGLTSLAASDSRFAPACANLNQGSPTAAAVVFEYMQRTKKMSLQQVLALDLLLAKQFARGHDFPEGVRALLIDKDKNPLWQPAKAEEVTPDLVARHFMPVDR